MPTKKGAGGRQQNYDPRTGRFATTDYAKLYPPREPTRKEKARKLEEEKRQNLFNRAKNSRDPLVFEVLCEIERNMPGTVQGVNEVKFDPGLGRPRELDIVTKRCIIEVKSSGKPNGLTQFLGQKRYADSRSKKHIVFAPNIFTAAKRSHERSGITIIKDYTMLIETIKEYEK